MNFSLDSIKTKLPIILIIFFIILVLSVLFFINTASTTSPKSSPVSTPNPYSPTHGVPYSIITNHDQEELNKDRAVAALIQKLPYTGSNFSLEYDFPTNQFTITFRQASLDQAKAEFTSFLRQNGIPDQSWLTNLVVQYK